MANPKVVSREEWLAERAALLKQERELRRASETLAAARRRMPMVRVEKDYEFEGPAGWGGRASLADLFDGRRQLIVYHFMFDPDDPPPGKSGAPWEEGCPVCSFVVDNLPHLAHLRARDTSLVLVSRAPLEKIEPFRERMGWTVPWYSSYGSDFNYDFEVSADPERGKVVSAIRGVASLEDEVETPLFKGEMPGVSVFLRADGDIFHTYSMYGRGVGSILATYHLLDLTPLGRQEDGEGSPDGREDGVGWIRHHDRYEEGAARARSCCGAGGERC